MRKIAIVFLLMVVSAWPCSLSFQKSIYSKHPGSQPFFRFERNGKIGFLDGAGREVIAPRFLPGWFGEEDFYEGLSPAQETEDLWGFIDTSGRWQIPARYWRTERFSEGLAAVTLPLKGYNFPMEYIDRTGRTVIDLPLEIGEAGIFSEGLAAVRLISHSMSIGKAGYIDRTGKMAIPPQFAFAGDFHNGLARVVLDGRCFIAGDSGERMGTPPSVPAATSCGGVPDFITARCKEGFIDQNGNVRFEFEGARDFSEGLAAVSVSGKWGFINTLGFMTIKPEFDQTREFSEAFAAVRQGSKWGYIDKTGVTIIPLQFTEADSFSSGLAKVNGGYIDQSGRRLITVENGTSFVAGLAHVTLGTDRFGYMDKKGKIVFRYRAAEMNLYK
jgi:WG repeat protein